MTGPAEPLDPPGGPSDHPPGRAPDDAPDRAPTHAPGDAPDDAPRHAPGGAVWIHRGDVAPTGGGALAGRTFGVKDNIDVAGMPTTAACPAFAFAPERSADVVDRLLGAGARCVGKTNMDQFATGLVGVRSPHGAPTNPLDPTLVPGGSSSGSAVA
ncbi:MAG: allophanate hydrolase, partial [Alphaproteobacteria bacterium]|nr:allophanate hydrolase [Alphaproteobacteria bacterium]